LLEYDLEDPLRTLIHLREYLKLLSLDEFVTILSDERFHPFNFTTGHLPGVFERDILVSDGQYSR